MHTYVPGDWLQDLLGFNEILHPHIHHEPVAGDQLLVQRILQVDPQLLTILVQVAQTKVVLLEDTQRLANLQLGGVVTEYPQVKH